MVDEAGVRLEPLGAFRAVMLAQAGQVLGSLGLLEQFKVPRRQKVFLDLVDVSEAGC